VLRNRFFKWGSSSLIGHLALFELTCGIPLFLFSVLTKDSDRTLTIASALYMAFVCSALVALGAALFLVHVFETTAKKARCQVSASILASPELPFTTGGTGSITQ
jgi:hypothetical protein